MDAFANVTPLTLQIPTLQHGHMYGHMHVLNSLSQTLLSEYFSLRYYTLELGKMYHDSGRTRDCLY